MDFLVLFSGASQSYDHAMPAKGRPLHSLDPDASPSARLGAEIRSQRLAKGLTLQALANLTGYSPQHISSAERAVDTVSAWFIRTLDRALHAEGALIDLLPAAIYGRERENEERNAARRAEAPPLPCGATHSEVGDDVDPINRRGLIGVGVGAALGLSASPAAAREVDPELVEHWTQLLRVLYRHDAMFGAHDVLDSVRREVGVIAKHRQVARGRQRVRLFHVEARWTGFAAWLANDTGKLRERDAWTERSLRLAQEVADPNLLAFAQMRRSQWASHEQDADRTVGYAEDAMRVPGTSDQTRARGALRAALGHALAKDADACQRSLESAYGLANGSEDESPGKVVDHHQIASGEARCWLWMKPSKAIPLYDSVLDDWPRDRRRYRGVHQARLALACAASGEHDRAQVEGRKALASARATKSSVATRELKQLGSLLNRA
jgi:transcriptional regulator with XRE-family HTH domain